MKKIIYILFLFISKSILYAQNESDSLLYTQKESKSSLNIILGKNTSTFRFIKSNGLKSKGIDHCQGNSFGIGMSIALSNKHFITPEFLYYEAGAKSDFNDTPISWKLNYIGLGCGYGIKVINKSRFSMIPGIIIGIDYMTKGTQTIGLKSYDVREIDALTNWNTRSNVYLNNRIKVSEFMYLILEYRFSVGLNQIENKDSNLNQKTRNINHHLLLGFNIQLNK
jgi:hypothetical protein